MDHTRRELLGAASMLVATTGCLGGSDDDAAVSSTERTITRSATPTESPTPTDEPTEEPTEKPTPAPDATVRIWPTSVTAVFEGNVNHDAIYDALGELPTSARIRAGERDGATATYVVAAGRSVTVPSVTEAFDAADGLSALEVFRGVGPNFRDRYESAFGEQVAERAGVDAESVSIIPGRLGDHQLLDISAPVDRSALVPMLPEMAFQRANGGSEETILEPGEVVADTEFAVSYHPGREKTVTFTVVLTDEGVSSFADAVEAASEEALRGDFFRPVVDGEAFSPLSVTDWLEEGLESGDWDGRLRLSFPDRLGTGGVITDLTGLPPVPFQFEPVTDQ